MKRVLLLILTLLIINVSGLSENPGLVRVPVEEIGDFTPQYSYVYKISFTSDTVSAKQQTFLNARLGFEKTMITLVTKYLSGYTLKDMARVLNRLMGASRMSCSLRPYNGGYNVSVGYFIDVKDVEDIITSDGKVSPELFRKWAVESGWNYGYGHADDEEDSMEEFRRSYYEELEKFREQQKKKQEENNQSPL